MDVAIILETLAARKTLDGGVQSERERESHLSVTRLAGRPVASDGSSGAAEAAGAAGRRVADDGRRAPAGLKTTMDDQHIAFRGSSGQPSVGQLPQQIFSPNSIYISSSDVRRRRAVLRSAAAAGGEEERLVFRRSSDVRVRLAGQRSRGFETGV